LAVKKAAGPSRDVAQGLIRAIRVGGVDGATFNVPDDAPFTALELWEIIWNPQLQTPTS
jgi:hypothetical protein